MVTFRIAVFSGEKPGVWSSLLCAFVMFGATELGERVFDWVPLPASGRHVPLSCGAVIFNGNLCDDTPGFESLVRDGGHAAANLAFVHGFCEFIGKMNGDLTLSSTCNEGGGQQVMYGWLFLRLGIVRPNLSPTFTCRINAGSLPPLATE